MPREERTVRHLVPGGNRAAVDQLDDQATQLSATPRNWKRVPTIKMHR
jgi:hypothetical protein